jgi:uncharacterized protein YkuJ
MQKQTYELRMELMDENKERLPMTVQFEVSGGEVVKVRGLDQHGEEQFDVSLVIRSKKYYGCWVCANPPCPPSPLIWYNPCPLTDDRKSE